MTVNLKPSVQFGSDNEKRVFEDCLESIKDACIDMPDCDGCPWAYFCKKHLSEESMADFLANFKMMLLDYEEDEEEEEVW